MISRLPNVVEQWLWGLAWLAAMASGTAWRNAYAATPGAVGTTLASWPGDEAELRDPDRFTLLLALHLECSCSRATLDELSRLIAKIGDRIAVRVLMVRPLGLPPNGDGALESIASRLPQVRIVEDPEGVRAERFGARTSQFALLYDSTGALRFSGGIKAASGPDEWRVPRESLKSPPPWMSCCRWRKLNSKNDSISV